MSLEKNAADVSVYDFTHYRGDTLVLPLDVFDADNAPVDLGDWEVSAWVKPNGGEPFELLCEVRGNHIDITITHESTKNADWRRAKYDVQMRYGIAVKTLLCGTITLIDDIAL